MFVLIRYCISAFLCLSVALADTVVLIHPDDEQSLAVQNILAGIQNNAADTAVHPISDLNTYDLSGALDDQIIVLGSNLVSQSADIALDSNVIGGGFYTPIVPAPSIDAYSLYPSIQTISDEIVKSGFDLHRLITVTTSNDYLTQLHIEPGYLAGANIEHIVKISADERSLARTWFETLRDIDPRTDAVYISDARFLESSGAYKAILEAAWKHRILVVSALPQYARRGVSIGFIPDLIAYGEQLSNPINFSSSLELPSQPRIYNSDLNTLVRVFNHRTLRHVGYSLPSDIDQLPRTDIVIK